MDYYLVPILGISLSSAFVWGFTGSIAVEIMAVYSTWDSSRGISKRYKNPSFWFVRALVACIGGGLADAYGIVSNHLLAANIGASAPAIIHSFEGGIQKFKEPTG
jgi:hypothetical protein